MSELENNAATTANESPLSEWYEIRVLEKDSGDQVTGVREASLELCDKCIDRAIEDAAAVNWEGWSGGGVMMVAMDYHAERACEKS
jgi:hypothetical protein